MCAGLDKTILKGHTPTPHLIKTLSQGTLPTSLKYTVVYGALDKTTFKGHYAYPARYTGVYGALDKTIFTGHYAYPAQIHLCARRTR